MVISTLQIKTALKEVLSEENEVGIQPTIVPPLEKQTTQINSSIYTQDVVDSLIHHKKYKGLKEEGQNETALSDDQGGEISGWWRRGRVELPVQEKLPRICYKLSQLFYLAWLASAGRV